jgi:hypothetical protein
MICKFCDSEINSDAYVLKIPCFYRHACKVEYLFCSEICKLKYTKNYCCYICNYDNNLSDVKDEKNVLKLCNLYPGNYSCYEKRKISIELGIKPNFEETECYFCKKKSFNNIETDNVIKCKKCFYKNDNKVKDERISSLITIFNEKYEDSSSSFESFYENEESNIKSA